jgi:dTMP kinase
VAKRTLPSLEEGKWVVCDRFVYSSRAYQGGAGGIGDDAVQTLHEIGSAGLRPNLTVLIDVKPETVAKRLATRDGDISDAIGGRNEAYHARVAAAFRSLAEADPHGVTIVYGEGTPEEVHRRIVDAVAPLLKARRCR